MTWARSFGGFAADSVSFELYVYGTVGRPLKIDGIDAKIVSTEAAPRGCFFPPVGAGDLPERPVDIDLDKAHPVGKESPDQLHGEWQFPLQVSQGDAERFFISASTSSRSVRFNIIIRYFDGTDKTLVVDDAGSPLSWHPAPAPQVKPAGKFMGRR
jgi:hypothetical protein